SVIVRDYNNAAVAGVIVTWSIGSGGTGSTVSQATDTTDGSGVSSVIRKLGQTAGAQSTVATVAGLVGSPVSVTATGTAGATTQMALNGGNNQTGTINSALAVPHTVQVSDAYGNGQAGGTVTWAVRDGGGTVSSPSPATAGTGTA